MSKQQEFIGTIENFIDAEWVEKSGVSLFNRPTGEQIGEVPLSSKEISNAAVGSDYRAYDSWRKLPVTK